MNLRDEARRLAVGVESKLFAPRIHSDDEDIAAIESALLAFAKLVLERPFQQRADFDEELFDLCRRDDYDGLWRAMTAELLRELEEGSNIESLHSKEQP